MSQALTTAYACGWSLATTLMAYVVVFRAGDGRIIVRFRIARRQRQRGLLVETERLTENVVE